GTSVPMNMIVQRWYRPVLLLISAPQLLLQWYTFPPAKTVPTAGSTLSVQRHLARHARAHGRPTCRILFDSFLRPVDQRHKVKQLSRCATIKLSTSEISQQNSREVHAVTIQRFRKSGASRTTKTFALSKR